MKLYIYDHCPYCVRARMIFGLKKKSVQIITLLNDDEDTPNKLIGQKLVPILIKDDGTPMPESLDIVRYIDSYDGKSLIDKSILSNPKLAEWIENTGGYVRKLCYPRWVDAPLAEFDTEKARVYFCKKKEASIGSFAQHLKDSKALIDLANAHLRMLEPLIVSSHAVNGKLSEDDFLLFPVLRSLSIVSGIRFPDKVENYASKMSDITGVPMHFNIAS